MKITEQELEQVAYQSRLDLAGEEKAACANSLNNILDYLDLLNQLDTSNIEPAAQVFPLKNVFREDKLQPSLSREQALANAPEEDAGSFKVPRIV